MTARKPGVSTLGRPDTQVASRARLLARLVGARLAAVPACAGWTAVAADPDTAGPAVHVLSRSGQEPDGDLEAIVRAGRSGWSASIFEGVFPDDGAVFVQLGTPPADEAQFEADAARVADRFVAVLLERRFGTSSLCPQDVAGVQAVLAARVVDGGVVPDWED